MLAIFALVASECGPPRCTEPLTTGATFDAEYMQLDASAVFAGIGLPLLLGMLSVVGECGYSFQVLAERRRARRSSADGTTEPRSPDNDSCLRV